MIAMIFEYWTNPEHADRYRTHTAALRREFLAADGALSVESFQSLSEPGKTVTLGFFRDEDALHAWRNHPSHRQAQTLGRRDYFDDYRLRIGAISRDYTKGERAQAPADSRAAHDPAPVE